MSDGKLTPDGSSKAGFFAALAPKPVFQFTSDGAGEIYVTAMRANTGKKSPSSSRKATLTIIPSCAASFVKWAKQKTKMGYWDRSLN